MRYIGQTGGTKPDLKNINKKSEQKENWKYAQKP
jgi:hypothetical protein